MMKFKILCVVGARPNFMKISPLMKALARCAQIDAQLIHTGQHYSPNMSKLFFDDLKLPMPDTFLGIGSADHGVQTAKIMIAFEGIIRENTPDLIVVVGDVNSTLACALVAVKKGVPVAHIEAGLRSFDMRMPEEINRILTDRISELLFVTEDSGLINLANEGISTNKVHFVGNLMIDTLLGHLEQARSSRVLETFGLSAKSYAVLTLHRPTNVDSSEQLVKIFDALSTIQREISIVFPVHPRTKQRFREFGLTERIASLPDLKLVEPLGYLDFLKLTSEAKFVLTDSGGIQEETTVLGVPCLTLRENTERPVTVTDGSNIVVGGNPQRLIVESKKILQGKGKTGQSPPLWDGKAAERVVEVILEMFELPR